MSKKKSSPAQLLRDLADVHQRHENVLARCNTQARAILDEAAECLGLTRAKLAQALDLSPSYMSLVACGKKKASAEFWLKFNDLLEQETRGKGA